MFRYTKPFLILSILSLTTLHPLILTAQSAAAQSVTCNPNEALERKYYPVAEEARSAIDRQEPEKALAALQNAIALTKTPNLTADVVRTWLLDTNGGDYKTSRFARLAQQLNSAPKSRAVLNQLLTLTNRLPSNLAADKAMAQIAIARQFVQLGQPLSAPPLLAQARQQVRLIKDSNSRILALIELAEGDVDIQQAPAAQALLTETEKAVQPLKSDDYIRLSVLERIAITYARLGNITRAQQIAKQLSSYPSYVENIQRGIVRVHIVNLELEAAERVAQAIASPLAKGTALLQVAIVHQAAKNSTKATQLFRQVVGIAAKDESVRDALLNEVVDAQLQAGRLNDALQLMVSIKEIRSTTLKAVVLAASKAGKTNPVKELLSEQFPRIKALSDSNEQRFRLWDVVQIAAAGNQFDWIQSEWGQISQIDYGLVDTQIIQLATLYAKSGKPAQAVTWLQKLPLENRPLDRIRAISAIALVAHRNGDAQFANQLLEQTLQTIDPTATALRDRVNREGGDLLGLESFKPYALGSIALVYSQTNQPEKMRQLLQQMTPFSNKIDDPQIAMRIDHPFTQFVEAGQYLGALQIAQGTAFEPVRQGRLQSLVPGLLNLNRFEPVMLILEQTPNPNTKTLLLLAIAQRYTELSRTQLALPILAQAVEVAKTIPGAESEFDHLGAEGGTVIPMENDRGSLLEAIALQYAQLNQPKEALKVANTLQEKATREEALAKIRCISQR